MNKHAAWLKNELDQWTRDGLIDDSTALAIAARYPTRRKVSWSHYLLSALGSLIFGLGIILFFAYNWADLPRIAKLFLVFAALILTHGTALWFRAKRPEQTNLIEGCHVLGTMLFGAGIWLIAQIYHMDEHYPTAFLVWGLGALTLAWAIPSVFQGLMATVLLSVWGLAETMDFRAVHLSSIALVAIGILPLAWWQRSRALLLAGLVTFIGMAVLNIGTHLSFSIIFNLLFTTGLLLVAASGLARRSAFPGSATILNVVGILIYGVCLFLMTFMTDFIVDVYLILYATEDSLKTATALQWVMLGIGSLVWLPVITPAYRKRLVNDPSRTLRLQHLLMFAALLVLLVSNWGPERLDVDVLSLACNLILLAHGVLMIIRGTDLLDWKQVALGCVILCALILVRFGDLFQSLLMRSLAFLFIGALLFVIGHQYSKRRAKEQTHA
ncbi:MAG: DUF2157 domain-containing protein [Granulosicoccus sp.]|nr:DUF2157 domain-containing protein [Granulosicoccus sp.]